MYIAGSSGWPGQAAVPQCRPEHQVRARYLNYRDVALESPAFYQVMFGAALRSQTRRARRQFASDAYDQFVAP